MSRGFYFGVLSVCGSVRYINLRSGVVLADMLLAG